MVGVAVLGPGVAVPQLVREPGGAAAPLVGRGGLGGPLPGHLGARGPQLALAGRGRVRPGAGGRPDDRRAGGTGAAGGVAGGADDRGLGSAVQRPLAGLAARPAVAGAGAAGRLGPPGGRPGRRGGWPLRGPARETIGLNPLLRP
ncbi:hypothetical protein SCOCK_240072 [Actinacidiphila cocklensis]|uniref:Uncharacterized protein n=1 Tax=Actinacidiphila cocklensis TaxID=887465 RepID=A0A9W4DV57_9ACTN|nr:hypothetical protein SCOCK_240072 [Actinacidiphila cocklensis]